MHGIMLQRGEPQYNPAALPLQVAYRCPAGKVPLHLTPPGMHPRDGYPEFLGGNIVFTPAQFARVNGFHVRGLARMLSTCLAYSIELPVLYRSIGGTCGAEHV